MTFRVRRNFRLFLAAACTALLAAPAVASADFAHVVAPGESLTSVAATDGLSIDQLAAANGLSPNADLVSGTTLLIPPQSVGGASSASGVAAATGDGEADSGESGAAAAPSGGGGSYVVQPGDTLSGIAANAGETVDQLAAANGLDPNALLLSGTVLTLSGGEGSGAGTSAPAASQTQVVSTGGGGGGSYVVQPGDTLSGIAANAGETVDQLAAANGLDPNGLLLSGTVLTLSGGEGSGSGTPASAAAQPVGAAAEGDSSAPPYPTPQTVTASQVGSIAAANGVPPSLAEAIGWQESGFNNDLVSSADARGVMQILPGTWAWIQQNLVNGGPPLAPASATDNVRGGVLMLRSLLNSTGGDAAEAAAGYFQGLSSVQQNGEYPSTQQYVGDVLALENQFGAGG